MTVDQLTPLLTITVPFVPKVIRLMQAKQPADLLSRTTDLLNSFSDLLNRTADLLNRTGGSSARL